MMRFITAEPETEIGKGIEEAVDMGQNFWLWLTDVDMWMTVLFAFIRIFVIFVLSRIVIRLVYKMIDRFLERQQGSRISVNPRRFITIGELLKNVTSVVFNFVLILIILAEFNFNLGPLLAGAGVLGLAIGFGAQSLVKDVITGFFIIFEDQFAVGDVVKSGEFRGTVEVIGLRTTRIKGFNGETFIIPNGLITSLTNYSLANSLAVVDLPVKNEKRIDETLALIRGALQGLGEKQAELAQDPEVLGIQSLTTSEYVVRIVAECHPNAREVVEREIYKEIKQAMEEQERRQAAGG